MAEQQDDHLAYGRYYPDSDRGASGAGDGARGLVGDTFNKLRDTYKSHQGSSQPSQTYNQGGYQGGYPTQNQPPQSGYSNPSHDASAQQYQQPQTQGRPPQDDKFHGLFGKLQGTVTDIGSEVAQRLGTAIDPQAYAEYGPTKPNTQNRFSSFAPPRENNDVKWYVDGCSYFWAVSRALENARESIWILDWWLSPELYLRRPPAKNEQYRLDRMLQTAAQRGVRVNVIVYKEVTQALTLSSSHTKHHLENLHPNIVVFRHPDHLPDRQELTSSITSSLQHLSLNTDSLANMSKDNARGLFGMTDDVILFWAHHEKLCLIDGQIAFMGGLDMCFGRWDTNQHAIADLHPSDVNDTVFPGQDYNNSRVLDFQDVVHWEKNELDRKTMSRMGWSDLSVSLHGPVVEDLRRHFVERWNFIYDTKYKVRTDSRYARLALYGQPGSTQQQQPAGSYQPGGASTYPPPPGHQPQAGAAPTHPPPGYSPSQQQQQPGGNPSYPPPPGLSPSQQQQPAASYQPYQTGGNPSNAPPPGQAQPNYQPSGQGQPQYTYSGQSFPPPPPGPPPGNASVNPSYQSQPQSQAQSQTPYFAPPPSQETSHSNTRGVDDHPYEDHERGFAPRRFKENLTQYGSSLRGQLAGQIHQYQDRFTTYGRPSQPQGYMSCQIVRSCAKWSNGSPLEHSIADAYAAIIRNSQHFVYIENQFFITSTGDSQKPVQNKIGAAIVERILRAARAGQKYKMIVVIPSVPCFAGDLRDDETLGTRAIMEFQYNSINRGGHSIMELIAREGFNPIDYIRFYNLRNYDRINVSGVMAAAELDSGVDYDAARRQYDMSTAGPGGYAPGAPTGAPRSAFDTTAPFQQYQQAAHQQQAKPAATSGRWDSVSECYMLGGEDIRNVPWDGQPEAEIDAFVSEELYVHSKVMIADDRLVVCGSANLNDRSQLGDHDSEIAIVIEDTTPVQSTMNGQPWTASRFAASLRQELFRKHLGLLPPQDYQRPDANFEPVGVPNHFDFDCPESKVVADPLSDTLQSLWNSRARTNTEIFSKVFHAVPDDKVRNWATYKEFFEYYFHKAHKGTEGKEEFSRPVPYAWGHVVRDDFAPGPEGVRQVKELLSQVKGTLVEMPLMFLIEEDIAKEGLTLNELTETLYT